MKLSNFEKYGLSTKDLINNLKHINNENELKTFADMYNISDVEDLQELSNAWTWIKEKVLQPVGGAVKSAFTPIKEAVAGRTKEEIDLLGRKIAQQIYPQGQFLPQTPQVQQYQWSDMMKYIPYVLFAILLINVIKAKRK